MKNRLTLILILICLAFFILGAFVYAAPSPKRMQSNGEYSLSEMAWMNCQEFVNEQYNLDWGKAQKYNAAQVSLSGSLYRVAIYYTDPGVTMLCAMTRDAAGTWHLVDFRHR